MACLECGTHELLVSLLVDSYVKCTMEQTLFHSTLDVRVDSKRVPWAFNSLSTLLLKCWRNGSTQIRFQSEVFLTVGGGPRRLLGSAVCTQHLLDTQACGKRFRFCEITGNDMSRMTRFSRPLAVQTVVSSFCNNANFSAVTKPQSTFFRLTQHYFSFLKRWDMREWQSDEKSTRPRIIINAWFERELAVGSRLCPTKVLI